MVLGELLGEVEVYEVGCGEGYALFEDVEEPDVPGSLWSLLVALV